MRACRIVRSLPAAVLLCLCFVVSAGAYPDEPPSNPPFTGCCYITGDTLELGTVTVYLPLSYKSGYLSFSDDGLFNVTNSSVSGVVYAGSRSYTFRCSSWSGPQYRDSSGSYYDYYDLTFTDIEYSNMEILEEFPPYMEVDSMLNYILIGFLGVIVLCLFMKRF